MCLPKAKKDNSAEIARKEEAKRQSRIKQGQQGIDQAFAGFDDPFFQKYQNQYSGYYAPQLDDQYSQAVKRLTLQLAQTGNLTGSTGADQLSKLKKSYDQNKISIANQAVDATNQLRGKIDSQKSQLYADNRAAADPSNATSAAAAAAQYLQPSAPSSPLADVFSNFFQNLGNNAAIATARRLSENAGVQSFGGSSGKNSSVYVV